MKIGIDTRLLEKKITGIGRFLENILNELPNYEKKNEYFLFSYKNNFNIDNFYYNININPISKLFPRKIYSFLWLNFFLPKYLSKKKINLFLSANHLLPFLKDKNRKDIIVVHDIFYKIHKEYHSFIYRNYLKYIFPNSLKKSDIIITVSHSSKNDLIKYCKINPQKIKVLYQFANKKFRTLDLSKLEKERIIKDYNLTEKFLLYVGVIENRKNIDGILKVADILKKRNRNEKFLLIGKAGHGFSRIIKEIKKRKTNVRYISFISDEMLVKIYNVAFLFIFPSLYEGFGLPPLEAMQCGTPVLASNSSSLPEVIGNGGLLFPKDDYEAYADNIEKLINNQIYYLEMRERALEQVKHFTPKQTIKTLLNILDI